MSTSTLMMKKKTKKPNQWTKALYNINVYFLLAHKDHWKSYPKMVRKRKNWTKQRSSWEACCRTSPIPLIKNKLLLVACLRSEDRTKRTRSYETGV